MNVLGYGVVGLLLSLLGLWQWPRGFCLSYLAGFQLVVGMPLGCGALWAMHRLTGGKWGEPLVPVFRQACRTLPFVALFFIPVLLMLRVVFPWAGNPEQWSAKHWYLNEPFFILRALIYFGSWYWIFQKLQRPSPRPMLVAGLGLVGIVVTGNFAMVDWVLSLQPGFYSSMGGLITLMSQWMGAVAFVIATGTFRSVSCEVRNDWGNLLLMTVMLWAYHAFSQLLIIWMGQLPNEMAFYQVRWQGGWVVFGTLLLGMAFALPFFLLLQRPIKRSPQGLLLVAGVVLIGRWLDTVWNIFPPFLPSVGDLPWTVWLLPVALVSVWLGVFK